MYFIIISNNELWIRMDSTLALHKWMMATRSLLIKVSWCYCPSGTDNAN